MGNPETAKKLFWKFSGHDLKSHLMTQKIFFEVLALYVSDHIKAITDPLGTWGDLKTA